MKKIILFFFVLCIWVGKAQAQFAGGDGTAANPYLISTPQQLANIATVSANNHHFKLMNDINLASYLAPSGAGYNGGQFWNPIDLQGTFDGNNYRIYNLKIERAENNVGLFRGLAGTIKRLTVEVAGIVWGYHQVGIIVGNLGTANGVILTDSEVIDCRVRGTVKTLSATGSFGSVGGIAGVSIGKITRCHSRGTVIAPGARGGGIVGSANQTIIRHCSSTMLLTDDNSYKSYQESSLGGIVGQATTTTIQDCYFAGSLRSELSAASPDKLGGIIGTTNSNVTLNKVYASCPMTNSASANPFKGGLIGWDLGATVSATDAYWDATTSGINFSASGVPITLTELQTTDFWNFDTIWLRHSSYNNSRPFLADETLTIVYLGNGNTSGLPPDKYHVYPYIAMTLAGGGTLARTNFIQTGWNTQANGSGTLYYGGAVLSFNPADITTITFYADWLPTYTIIYNGNGHTSGTPPTQPTRYLPGQSAPVQNAYGVIFKTGFAPGRWNTQPDGSGTSYEFGSSLVLPASDVTLYVQWIPALTVTYMGTGSTSGMPPVDSTVYFTGIPVTFPFPMASLSKPGYLSYHWNTAPDGSGTRYYNTLPMPTQNLVLYPEWVRVNEGGDGTPANPYLISNAEQLHHVRTNMSAHYKLIADIDLTAFLAPNGYGYNGGAFWLPIGAYGNRFVGGFDGNYKKIKGLKINRHYEENIGLFGFIQAPATINRVGVEIDVAGVLGQSGVGGLIGYGVGGLSNITECYVEGGKVQVDTEAVGKLVGHYEGGFTRCYAKGSPIHILSTGLGGVGGMVGTSSLASIQDCFARVSVFNGVANTDVTFDYIGGGLIDAASNGYIERNYTVTPEHNPYMNSIAGNIYNVNFNANFHQNIGTLTSTSSTPKTEAEMKTASTFTSAGWDFTNVWGIDPAKNDGYPYLRYRYQYGIAYLAPDRTGGNLPTDNTRYIEGASATVLGAGTLTRAGYCLVGWNTKANGTGTSYAVGSMLVLPAENVTLYAQWTTTSMVATVNNTLNVLVGSALFQVPYTLTSGTATHYSLSSNLPNFVAVNNAPLAGSPITVGLPTNTTLGTFDFVLTLRNVAGGCEQSYPFTIVIYDNASPTERRGNALKLNGINQYAITSSVLSSVPINVTTEAWIKQNALPPTGQRALIFYHGNPLTGGYGLFIDHVGKLIVWHEGINIVDIGVLMPLGTWVHVAHTIDVANTMSVYVNGKTVASFHLGAYPPTDYFRIGNEYWAGEIDEVRFWSIARTADEIRQNMHLTLPTGATGLANYYQFNDNNATFANDWVGNKPATFQNTPIRVGSGANVSKGVSFTIGTPTAGTDYSFTGTGITLNFGNSNGGNVVASRLEGLPAGTQVSGANSVHTKYYWVINNYGGTNTGLNVTATFVLGAGQVSAGDATTPSNLKLNKRSSNSGGAWSSVINGSSANASTGIVQFTGIDGFSEFVISSSGSSPLPITLLEFRGERRDENNVLLTWKTATEINNKGFEIETSKNAQNFTKIAFVDGAGNSNNIKNYQLNAQNSDDAYYRLKQIDFNGEFSYSNIIFIKGSENIVNVYPNPSNENINIKTSKEGFVYEIFTLQGNSLIKNNETSNSTSINIKSLPKGIYFVHIIQNNMRVVRKIVVE
ncbi:MAG: T9SS C-terminal target domain-containing protein [Bacteroidetes bacterium]|nr:MAG: T9SS C-terminal target domain-containing protein [Bacteroidota bacterium]TAG87717.1 MAG: T9SS C-terminal target domain-containing protein [Bacteroidota bacterium]